MDLNNQSFDQVESSRSFSSNGDSFDAFRMQLAVHLRSTKDTAAGSLPNLSITDGNTPSEQRISRQQGSDRSDAGANTARSSDQSGARPSDRVGENRPAAGDQRSAYGQAVDEAARRGVPLVVIFATEAQYNNTIYHNTGEPYFSRLRRNISNAGNDAVVVRIDPQNPGSADSRELVERTQLNNGSPDRPVPPSVAIINYDLDARGNAQQAEGSRLYRDVIRVTGPCGLSDLIKKEREDTLRRRSSTQPEPPPPEPTGTGVIERPQPTQTGTGVIERPQPTQTGTGVIERPQPTQTGTGVIERRPEQTQTAPLDPTWRPYRPTVRHGRRR